MAVPAPRRITLAVRTSMATASPVMRRVSSATGAAMGVGDGWVMRVSKQMDLDAYSTAHGAEWDRLDRLGRLRWITLAVFVATVVVSTLYATWALADPQVLATYGTPESRRSLVEGDFVDYYSENPAASFAGMVWTNNAWVAAQCIALGITGV